MAAVTLKIENNHETKLAKDSKHALFYDNITFWEGWKLLHLGLDVRNVSSDRSDDRAQVLYVGIICISWLLRAHHAATLSHADRATVHHYNSFISLYQTHLNE